MASYNIPQLISDLRELMAFPVEDKISLQEWYELSTSISNNIRSNPDLSNLCPEIVWHYLSDGDIRFKDSEYGQTQTKSLLAAIERLEIEYQNNLI
jgi:hypothetical protein